MLLSDGAEVERFHVFRERATPQIRRPSGFSTSLRPRHTTSPTTGSESLDLQPAAPREDAPPPGEQKAPLLEVLEAPPEKRGGEALGALVDKLLRHSYFGALGLEVTLEIARWLAPQAYRRHELLFWPGDGGGRAARTLPTPLDDRSQARPTAPSTCWSRATSWWRSRTTG